MTFRYTSHPLVTVSDGGYASILRLINFNIHANVNNGVKEVVYKLVV